MSVQFGKLTQRGNYTASNDRLQGGPSAFLNYKGTIASAGDYSVKTSAMADRFTAEFQFPELKFKVEQDGLEKPKSLNISYEQKLGKGFQVKALSAKIQNEVLKDAQVLMDKSKRMLDILKNAHKISPELQRLVYDDILKIESK